jgi:hypothetical protein
MPSAPGLSTLDGGSMEAVVYRGARKLEIEDRVAEAIRLVAL